MQIALVCARDVVRARLTVRHARAAIPNATIHVLDLTTTYRRVTDEVVYMPESAGISTRELHRHAVVTEPAALDRSFTMVLAERVRTGTGPLLILPSGVVLLRRPVVPAGNGLVVLSCAAGGHYAAAEDPAFLLSAGTLRREHCVAGSTHPANPLILDGRPVTALDATGLDPARPWLLDASLADPRGRLSEHPALAAVVAALAEEMLADQGGDSAVDPLATTSLGTPVDAPLRAVYRAVPAEAFGIATPDPFEPTQKDALLAFLTTPTPQGGPGRYLEALRSTRPDLQQAFPRVPGADDAAFLSWARKHAIADGTPALLVEASVVHLPGRRTARQLHLPRFPRRARHRPHGVNVVGFLRGELGIGESARLLIGGLRTAGVPYRTVPIDQHLASRQGAAIDLTEGEPVYDTSIICVNADLTPAISASVADMLAGTHRIGMWYWEVEDFPATQHGGFDHVDEVWTATDFVHDAIARHSPVPVRTVTPPLPQRAPEPTLTRADLGLPNRPIFLFSFDFLSTAERKNPWGLVEAFRRAFIPDEGPVLVIKSINAERRTADAERLRLTAARHTDVLLMERYVDAAERDALVALCDCYVSLHRSEGLGLTMAEAMAWGKPVIATAYSGNLQFMTEDNSFLVPWSPTVVPPDAAPYPAGTAWADPDLDAAAAAMRFIIDRPQAAAERGARAASDIATLHSARVAGEVVVEQLCSSARSATPSRITALMRPGAHRIPRGYPTN